MPINRINDVNKEVAMNGISNVSQSIDAVNQILQSAQAKTIKTAEKMIKVNTEMALGKQTGKGELIDLFA